MKSYFLASACAFIAGWFAQTIAFAIYLIVGSSVFRTATNFFSGAVAFWMFSLVANLLFIQLPRTYIKKLFFKTNTILFSSLLAVYGLAIFGLTLGLLTRSSMGETIPLYTASLINGFVFGLTFHSLWKPTQVNV